MNVLLSGWARNHGYKTIISERLEECNVTEGFPNCSFAKGSINIKKNEHGRTIGISYSRGVSISANGDYRLDINFSTKDIVFIAFLCMKELSMMTFSKLFWRHGARDEEITEAKKVLSIQYKEAA